MGCSSSKRSTDSYAAQSKMIAEEESIPGKPFTYTLQKSEPVIDLPTKEHLAALDPDSRAEAIIECGAVKFLSVNYLLECPDDWAVLRCQDLPPEALLEPSHAACLYTCGWGLVIMSYGWVTKAHPDPTGHHFRTLKRYLKKHVELAMAQCTNRSERRMLERDLGVFWDYASLPQAGPNGKRTAREQALFSRGLQAINLLYGKHGTMTVQLKSLPPSFKDKDGNPSNTLGYNERGWCFFEQASASIIKGSNHLVDLTQAQSVVDDEASTESVRDVGTVGRLPPLTPDDMAVALKKRKFTNGNDCEVVSGIYKKYFEEIAPTMKGLMFNNKSKGQGWGDAEAQQFARALPFFTSCFAVYLDKHHAMGEAGLKAVFKAVQSMPNIRIFIVPAHLQETATAKEMNSWWQSRNDLEETDYGLMWGELGRRFDSFEYEDM